MGNTVGRTGTFQVGLIVVSRVSKAVKRDSNNVKESVMKVFVYLFLIGGDNPPVSGRDRSTAVSRALAIGGRRHG
jgi:hypothetical protein